MIILMVLGKKRGLSPVVATVLLIALAIILAMIIFLWARGWISEQIEKKGTPIDMVCESVKIKFDYQRTINGLSIIIVNLGSIPIHAIEIRQEDGGSSKLSVHEINVPPFGTSDAKEIAIESGATKMIIYPQLMGNVRGKKDNRVTTCLNSGKSIDL